MPASSVPILTLPDPRLRHPSTEISAVHGLDVLCQTLVATMMAGSGAVGIAAPQIGVLQRVIIIDCRQARHACSNHGQLCMINPHILTHSGNKPGREGCLSVPDWVATVRRATKIRLKYQDCALQWQELEAVGFEARVIQHEIDHLNGILFIDRITSTRDMVRRMVADASKK